MKKIVIHSPGGYEKLQVESFPDPEPGEGEVLIESSAMGVNYADCCIRWGVYESAKKYVGWPITPGFEVSGTVKKVGSGVKGIKEGAQVFGLTRFNGYSTHVIVPEHQVFPIPQGFTLEEAAGFPAVFMTAYHALFQNVYIRPGMTALVHSAAGGVGSALVQLCKLARLNVIAVVGASHKVAYVKELGADLVIDKSSEDLWNAVEEAAPQGLDLVFDANGYTTLAEGYRRLRPTGKMISYGFHAMLPKSGGRMNYLKAALGILRIPRFSPLHMTNANKGVVGFNLSFLFERRELLQEAMQSLLTWANEGKLRPPKVSTFPMDEVAKAHQKIESGTSIGKLVLLAK